MDKLYYLVLGLAVVPFIMARGLDFLTNWDMVSFKDQLLEAKVMIFLLLCGIPCSAVARQVAAAQGAGNLYMYGLPLLGLVVASLFWIKRSKDAYPRFLKPVVWLELVAGAVALFLLPIPVAWVV